MARREYTRNLEKDFDKLKIKNLFLEKKLKKLKKAGEKKKMSANPTFFEKLGSFISKIRAKEVQFDKEYVKEIKADACKNIRQYQLIVLCIKVVEKMATAFIVWQVLAYLTSKSI